MNILCVIPARGGSTRVPGKNLRLVAGRPLLAHSIEHALQSTSVDRIVVSTEDPAIAEVSARWNAEVIRRPVELATDTASSELALLHVLDFLLAKEGWVPDLVVFLQCTSPVRTPDDIDRAVRLLNEGAADSLFSATASHEFIWRRENGSLRSLNYDHRARHRSQDHPEEFRENGSIYIFKPWVLRQFNNRLGGRIVVYPMDYWSAFQVDHPEDLILVDWLLREAVGSGGRLSLPTRPSLVVFDFDGVMTDNRALVTSDGQEAVFCDRGDGLGIERLVRSGIPVLVLSSEVDRVVEARCAKLKLPCLQGIADKWAVLGAYLAEKSYRPEDVIYVGNDMNDVECLKRVGWGVVVSDAHREARRAARIVLRNQGGHGAVRELCDLILAEADGGSC